MFRSRTSSLSSLSLPSFKTLSKTSSVDSNLSQSSSLPSYHEELPPTHKTLLKGPSFFDLDFSGKITRKVKSLVSLFGGSQKDEGEIYDISDEELREIEERAALESSYFVSVEEEMEEESEGSSTPTSTTSSSSSTLVDSTASLKPKSAFTKIFNRTSPTPHFPTIEDEYPTEDSSYLLEDDANLPGTVQFDIYKGFEWSLTTYPFQIHNSENREWFTNTDDVDYLAYTGPEREFASVPSHHHYKVSPLKSSLKPFTLPIFTYQEDVQHKRNIEGRMLSREDGRRLIIAHRRREVRNRMKAEGQWDSSKTRGQRRTGKIIERGRESGIMGISLY